MVDYLFILRPPGGTRGSSSGEEALGCPVGMFPLWSQIRQLDQDE